MKTARKESGQVLILMGAWWLFFGGGGASALVVYDRSVSEVKKAVKRVIPASDRREVILFDIHLWETGQKKRDERVSADRKKLLDMLRRQGAQRSEVGPMVASLDTTFLEMDRNFLDLRFRVRDNVTSAEWAQLVARGGR